MCHFSVKNEVNLVKRAVNEAARQGDSVIIMSTDSMQESGTCTIKLQNLGADAGFELDDMEHNSSIAREAGAKCALHAVTHLTLHPYNTKQQTNLHGSCMDT